MRLFKIYKRETALLSFTFDTTKTEFLCNCTTCCARLSAISLRADVDYSHRKLQHCNHQWCCNASVHSCNCVCCYRHLPSVDSRTTRVMAINENMIVTAWNNNITIWLWIFKENYICLIGQRNWNVWWEEDYLEEDGNACWGSHDPVLRDAHPSLNLFFPFCLLS